jgi:hypothetical protein
MIHPKPISMFHADGVSLLLGLIVSLSLGTANAPPAFPQTHCIECHDGEVKKGGLDLTALSAADAPGWTKVHDRIAAGGMPPAKKPRPEAGEQREFLQQLPAQIVGTEVQAREKSGRTVFRRLNRTEHEHTLRDLLLLPHLKSGRCCLRMVKHTGLIRWARQ